MDAARMTRGVSSERRGGGWVVGFCADFKGVELPEEDGVLEEELRSERFGCRIVGSAMPTAAFWVASAGASSFLILFRPT